MPHLLKALHTRPHLGELERALLRRRGVLADFLRFAVLLLTDNVIVECEESLEGGLACVALTRVLLLRHVVSFHLDVVGLFNYVN